MKPPTSPQAASAAATPKTTTIERIARAIHEAKRTAPYPWSHADPDQCVLSRHIAKAALQALHQVDEGTVEAMVREADELHSGCGPMVESATELHGLMFTAAIDHILSQGGEG